MRHPHLRAASQHPRGFSRLDVAGVLATLLLLASIAVPAFRGYVERGRVARAVSEIGTMSLTLYRRQRDTQTLPATLAEAGIGGNDPWGRPYVYVRVADASPAQLRRDVKLTALNTDFDLFSFGADGESAPGLAAEQSRDDVVRAADGTYIGLGVNY